MDLGSGIWEVLLGQVTTSPLDGFSCCDSCSNPHPIILPYILEDRRKHSLLSSQPPDSETTVGSCFIVPAPRNSWEAEIKARSEQKSHSPPKCACPQRLLLMSPFPAPTSRPFLITQGKDARVERKGKLKSLPRKLQVSSGVPRPRRPQGF